MSETESGCRIIAVSNNITDESEHPKGNERKLGELACHGVGQHVLPRVRSAYPKEQEISSNRMFGQHLTKFFHGSKRLNQLWSVL